MIVKDTVPPSTPDTASKIKSETPRSSLDALTVVGVNFRSAGRRLRDSLFAEEPDCARILGELRAAEIGECLLIATCERFDLVSAASGEGREDFLYGLIAREAGQDLSEIRKQSYCHQGADALRHLFAVAASLDSQIVGEPQILGQVKACHKQARDLGLSAGLLDDVMQAAIAAAKRVRTETTVAQQPITLASSALQVARSIHGDLARCRVLLTGTGEVGELLAGEFRDAGVAALEIAHPRAGRGQTAVFRLGGQNRDWRELDAALAESDVVLAALGRGEVLFPTGRVEQALKKRRRKPIFLIDTSPSGDIDPSVNDLDGAYAYNLQDLEQVARQGKAQREAATMAAWKILGAEMTAFTRLKAARQADPVITRVRQHFEALRRQVLEECGGDAQAATRLLVNRLLHDPQTVLKEAAAESPADRAALEEALRRLFRLEDVAAPDPARNNTEEE